MKEVLAYKCEYCDELFNTKEKTTLHETICRNNKDLNSCYRCYNFIRKIALNSYGGGEDASYCRLDLKTQNQYKENKNKYYNCSDFEFISKANNNLDRFLE